MVIYDVINDFISDKSEMKHMLTVDTKAFVSYLTYICEKLNILNKQLHASNKTLVDTMTKIFGFATFIEVCKNEFPTKILTSFIG